MRGGRSLPAYYAATAGPAPDRPSLSGDVACDACVVGGGYTGLHAALHLRERGWEVVVLEADRVGGGASGRNGGQVLSGWAAGLATVVGLVGRGDARRLWDLAEEGKDLLHATIARHGIDCGFRPGHLSAAVRPRHLRAAEAELALFREFGYGRARMVERDELASLVASPLYVGGLLDEGGGHLHPMAYARGLAAAAEAAGVRIFEHSPAVDFDGGPPALAHTPGGTVRARHLVLCGNVWLGRLLPGARSRLAAVSTQLAVTEPLGAEVARRLIPADIAVSDMCAIPDYFRLMRDGRLLFGGGASYVGASRDPGGLLARRLARVFPQIAGVRFTDVWTGEVAITAERMPYAGRAGDNVWYAAGFSGHGVAVSGVVGRVLAEAASGRTDRFDLLARIPHLPFPGGPLRRPLLALAMTWYRLRDAL